MKPTKEELEKAIERVKELAEFCERLELDEAPSLRTVLAALEATQKDSERLDWLDDNTTYTGGGSGGVYSFKTPADVETGMLRTAIDAARTP